MLLIFADESGINYKEEAGFYKDGPFILQGGMCIHESNYFHLEKLFIDLIENYFSIDDWLMHEIHATDIWNRKGLFEKYEQNTIKKFFEELLQLICKLSIHCNIGITCKTIQADSYFKSRDMAKAIYSFLHCIEYHLAEKRETGIIISDMAKDDKGEVPSIHRDLLDKILLERMHWRYNPKTKIEFTIQSRYEYESKSCYILDNIHYINSKHSIFIQIFDLIIYVIRKMLLFQFLVLRPDIKKPQDDKNPVTISTFQFFLSQVARFAFYNDSTYDVSFTTGTQLANAESAPFIIDKNFFLSIAAPYLVS